MTDPSPPAPLDPGVAPGFDVSLGGRGIHVSTSDERDFADPLSEDLSQRISAVAHDVLRGEGIRDVSVSVFFVSEAQIAELNEKHLGGHGPTDVLSFPLDDPSEGNSFGFTPHAGDIVICPEIARVQAAQHAGSFEDEMILLAVHAVLHLLGHDHRTESERRAMQALEANYLSPYGIIHPGDQR